MQQIEIGEDIAWEPPSRLDQPGVKAAPGPGPMQEREHRDHVQRQGDDRFDPERRLAGDEFTHVAFLPETTDKS